MSVSFDGPFLDGNSNDWDPADWVSIRIDVLHQQPVVCEGLAKWFRQSGLHDVHLHSSHSSCLSRQTDKASITFLGIESMFSETNGGASIGAIAWNQTVVITTAELLIRFGRQLPESCIGLVSPRSGLDVFGRAIDSAVQCKQYIDPRLMDSWEQIQNNSLMMLTERQLQILRLVANGQSSKQIGASLGIRQKTVENHRSQIMKRMKVVSSAEMINVAHHQGWV